MARRDVDSTILRELASKSGAARGELESAFSNTRRRVDSAPGGWDRGRWEGVPSFIRMELESLDREQRELNERAAKVEIAAAVRDLPTPLPLSAFKFLLRAAEGLAEWFGKLAGGVAEFVSKFADMVINFVATTGKATTAEFERFAGAAAGTAGLALGAARLSALGEMNNETAGRSAQLKPSVGQQRNLSLPSTGSTRGGANPVAQEAMRLARLGADMDRYAEEMARIYGSDAKAYPPGVFAGVADMSKVLDCTTFAGATLIATGIASAGTTPGRGGPRVRSTTEEYGLAGWTLTKTPGPGTFLQVNRTEGNQHASIYLGSVGGNFVIAESNVSRADDPFGGPVLRVISPDGRLLGRWDESMGDPVPADGTVGAAAITKYYSTMYGKSFEGIRFFEGPDGD